ncbi:hypothetical protein K474DRAFT_60107 [Panus rudis PR-1116 ss-1]|nr:hypothetical protein K474DRAFT_60107 [Panus rudis PR-1116 ss-1]
MTTNYGLPLILEDQSGDIAGSEFKDIYDRMSFSLRCTRNDPSQTVFMICDHTLSSASSRAGLSVPVACLTFGANHALGTVKIGDGSTMDMAVYLSRVGRNPKARKFVASDGQEYRWTHRPGSTEVEYQCVNANGYEVASYTPKPAGEPAYTNSSGCSLTVEESYGTLAGEFLASLTIMRHMVKYNL